MCGPTPTSRTATEAESPLQRPSMTAQTQLDQSRGGCVRPQPACRRGRERVRHSCRAAAAGFSAAAGIAARIQNSTRMGHGAAAAVLPRGEGARRCGGLVRNGGASLMRNRTENHLLSAGLDGMHTLQHCGSSDRTVFWCLMIDRRVVPAVSTGRHL